NTPASKSIQCGFKLYRFELVETFTVGTKVPKGVPLPVVNNTIWQPDAPKAVDATKSLPGALKRFKPFFLAISPYFKTSTTLDSPPLDRKSTRLNSSHVSISYAGFCLKKK